MGAAEALGGSIRDRLKNAFGIAVEFVVPDPNDDPTFLSKELVAPPVPLGLGMLTATQLNDQPRSPAGEVRIKGAHWQLARER